MYQFRYLKEFFCKHWRKYCIGISLLILCDGFQLVMPKILGNIADSIQQQTITMKEIYYDVFLIIALAIVVALLRYGWRMYIMGTSRHMEFWLRNRFFAHLETLSMDFYASHKTGDLMAHATNDINAIRMTFGQAIMMLTDNLFLTFTTIIIMFTTIDIRLSLLALLPLPFIALLTTVLGKKMQKRHRGAQAAFSELTNGVQENISGIRVIKSFVQETAEIQKFSVANQSYVEKNMKVVQLNGFMRPLIMSLASLSYIIAFYTGGNMVISGQLTLGQLIEFISYLSMLTWPMMAFGFVINMLQRGLSSLGRLNTIFDLRPDIVDTRETKNIQSFEPTIEFRNLTFTYNGALQPALNQINFTLEKGKTLAIIGRTGSGKTTISNLLFRLFDAPKGSILIGGHAIHEIPLSILRTHMGIVPQDNFLFSTSIRENIAFSNENLSFDAIVEAAHSSNIYEDIINFPLGFDTVLGERGVTLSGGQKQRISIARALVKNPDILILDDCLSAVDTKTEEKILENLKVAMVDKTCIIIAHRISSIKHADQIIVLDKGAIVEQGNHESLLDLQGIYHSIYTKQLLENKITSTL